MFSFFLKENTKKTIYLFALIILVSLIGHSSVLGYGSNEPQKAIQIPRFVFNSNESLTILPTQIGGLSWYFDQTRVGIRISKETVTTATKFTISEEIKEVSGEKMYIYYVNAHDLDNEDIYNLNKEIAITINSRLIDRKTGLYFYDDTKEEWILNMNTNYNYRRGKINFDTNKLFKFAIISLNATQNQQSIPYSLKTTDNSIENGEWSNLAQDIYQTISTQTNSKTENEAQVIYNYNNFVNLTNEEKKLYMDIMATVRETTKIKVQQTIKYSLAYFIHMGTENTNQLTSEQRTNLIEQYILTNKNLPNSENDWLEIISST